MEQPRISVIIPTLNAGTMIGPLLTRLEQQRRVPDEIIVVDSSSDDDTVAEVRRHPNVHLTVIDRKDFNHGGTRDRALRASSGEYVLFLTQDALPKDDRYTSTTSCSPSRTNASRSSTGASCRGRTRIPPNG